MSQSQDPVPILTLSNWHALEIRAVNVIANFGEAGKAAINTPYVLMEPCQSPTVQYRQQYLDPIDGMTKIRIAERPWSDARARPSSHQVQRFEIKVPSSTIKPLVIPHHSS